MFSKVFNMVLICLAQKKFNHIKFYRSINHEADSIRYLLDFMIFFVIYSGMTLQVYLALKFIYSFCKSELTTLYSRNKHNYMKVDLTSECIQSSRYNIS